MPTRRSFLVTSAGAAAAPGPLRTRLAAVDIARRHNLVRDLPTPDFFEGMILGNGDIGAVVVVRPDALGIHLGKLDVWDIRVSEDHARHVLPFPRILEMWREAGERAKKAGRPDQIHLENSDAEFRRYYDLVRSSYSKPWPRPWPCGTVWLHWDSRLVRLKRQELDLATGILHLDFEQFRLVCFVSWSDGHVLVTSDGAAPVVSAAYYPHFDSQARLPAPEAAAHPGASHMDFTGYQLFLATAPTEERPDPGPSPQDRSFALHARLQGAWQVLDRKARRPEVFLKAGSPQPLRMDLALVTSRDHPRNREEAARLAARAAAAPIENLKENTRQGWHDHWSRSAVEFDDRELERIWYRNQYFLACCLKPGKVAPGLFGNWSHGNIGTAWHGDYHMNYNTQQVFWGVFSSNHVEQHLPYVDLVEMLMPMARWNAKEQFGLPGAYFPHTAYPVPSQVNPYPVPPWGYEICETPWTVQSLWWHYLYTQDQHFLKRVYPILREATDFLVAFLKKGEDGKYHVIPTVSPENWGMTVDFRLNRDCIIDLALIEFLLDAMAEASRLLGVDADLRPSWAEVRANLAPYPSAEGPSGRVWLDVADGPHEYVFNVPVTLAPIFPAEQTGIGHGEKLGEIALRTLRTVRLEGGNDLVWLPLAHARMGVLDLEWFKREVRYCLLANGVANDRVLQIGGRYSDQTNFDFMMRMGVWTENLSLPAVLNECLLQSYSGVIRLFPNRKGLGAARLETLRAAGAFLVSAAWDGRTVRDVRLASEKGAEARLENPWHPAKAIVRVESPRRTVPHKAEGNLLVFSTKAGETYTIARA